MPFVEITYPKRWYSFLHPVDSGLDLCIAVGV